MRVKPKIFVPNSPENDLIEVLIEEYKDYDILWFHWPKDGHPLKYRLVQEEDFEPVIIFYDKGKICMIYTRRHWFYQDYNKKEGLVLPPQILFDGEDHPPYVKRTEDDKEFLKKCEKLIKRDYEDPKSIKRSDIEEKFRTGKGHGRPPGSLVAKAKDPHDKARECFKKYLERL